MEASGGTSSGASTSTQFSPSNVMSAFFDRMLRSRSGYHEGESSSTGGGSSTGSSPAAGAGEVAIRIFDEGEQQPAAGGTSGDGGGGGGEGNGGEGGNGRDSSYQSAELQQFQRWAEQLLPFAVLLFFVLLKQHWQGIFILIWITVMMVKSNDILQKQTALKGERNFLVLIGVMLLSILNVVGVYWWLRKDDLLYPLIMLPPKEIPPFWHAIFIIMVNDTMARQASMFVKCMPLMYYKIHRARDHRKQGKMLTAVEYFSLFYRVFLPTPVWYRFFLNKEYGSIFSTVITGFYLTFKMATFFEKFQSFYRSVKAFSRRELRFGSYVTTEQVIAVDDLCAICQEKMRAPIVLCCKHIFCEDCVSDWLERERTCPMCRTTVRPEDLRSYADGSTSMLLQVF